MSLSTNTPQPKPSFKAGLKIKGSEFNEHFTILHAEEGLSTLIDSSDQLKDLPKKLEIIGEGTHKLNGKSVWCAMPMREDIIGMELIISLLKQYKVLEDGNIPSSFFFPHIKKKEGTRLKVGDVVEVESFFIKETGSRYPFFVVKL